MPGLRPGQGKDRVSAGVVQATLPGLRFVETEGTVYDSCESDDEALWLSDSRATKRCVRQAQRSVGHLSNVRG